MPEPMLRMKGSDSSYLALARSLGSFLRHRLRKLRMSDDPPAMFYGGLLAIMTIAMMGFILR